MTHTFTKRSFKGFTLIELLVVIAIIGLLSTVIAAPIQNARKKSRDAKKIAELKAVELALDQYAEANQGQYPANFQQLAGTYMPILPVFTGTTTAQSQPRDRFTYTYYEGQQAGMGSTYQVFAYHIGTHLESQGPALDSDRDCSGAVSSITLTGNANVPFPCAYFNGTALLASAVRTTYANYQANMICGNGIPEATATTTPTIGTCVTTAVDTGDASGVAQQDIGVVSDGNNITCNLVNDCIFDMSNQQ